MALGKTGWFYGWYFKCQSDTQTLAVIAAVHRTDRKRTCSIQIITEKQSWTVPLQEKTFRKRGRMISIGKNWFGERGICLSVCVPGLKVSGQLVFGELFPLRIRVSKGQ